MWRSSTPRINLLSPPTPQVLLFAILAVEIKRKAPTAHTCLEIVKARWGTPAHITFFVFCILTNIIVTSMLILGGAATMQALTGAWGGRGVLPVRTVRAGGEGGGCVGCALHATVHERLLLAGRRARTWPPECPHAAPSQGLPAAAWPHTCLPPHQPSACMHSIRPALSRPAPAPTPCPSCVVPCAGMNLYAASILIPVGVMFYTAHGGLRASYLASWANTSTIYIALCIFAFMVYASGIVSLLP